MSSNWEIAVLALIDELGRERAAFVVVTHDPGIAGHMHRTLELVDGELREAHELV